MTTSPAPQRPPATIVFIFGGSGDLNFRKLTPALYNLFLDGYMPEHFDVVGIGRSDYNDDTFRERLAEGIQEFSRRKNGPDNTWGTFSGRVGYLRMDGGDAAAYHLIADRVKAREDKWGTPANIIFYMSVAPQLVPGIATNLSQLPFCGDKSRVRLVVEKPFGHDLQSARELNALLLSHFAEEQIYRIDHYLGKETVQNILAMRFANTLFEPIWNHNYVESVQLTAAETVGLEGRGGYYEGSGALRDMIQNHLLQLLCMVAMEPPTSFEADEIRNKKVDVLRAMRRVSPDQVDTIAVRGQYGAGEKNGKSSPAYRQEEGVKPDSMTETFAAVTFFCDNWRWEGTPFYVRTGKHLAAKSSVITVQFRPAPHYAFPNEATKTWQHNCLIISIQPDMNIRLRFQAKRPGQTLALDPVEMEFNYDTSFKEQQPEAYETLLLDVMAGDATLFMRADQVDEAWQIVMPILDHWAAQTDPDAGPPAAMPTYAPGSWGPDEATKLTERDGFTWMNG
ncbi:glucose-6-phosphate dehydrogenase [Fibrella aquatilis]|uniref:Glucose-6-phosphate 1-dehydrogenase n=1 Tax=Fibrella aquatilis TaxID=2817059 RepID=A0A939G7N4_9BACT|nr:glucose-6-phosphate dehydrogenase [Fibrella aquatilis]MBO0931551.1 glucose-6-phosphate dehydrogenase [Fibrella aquatilis]